MTFYLVHHLGGQMKESEINWRQSLIVFCADQCTNCTRCTYLIVILYQINFETYL